MRAHPLARAREFEGSPQGEIVHVVVKFLPGQQGNIISDGLGETENIFLKPFHRAVRQTSPARAVCTEMLACAVPSVAAARPSRPVRSKAGVGAGGPNGQGAIPRKHINEGQRQPSRAGGSGSTSITTRLLSSVSRRKQQLSRPAAATTVKTAEDAVAAATSTYVADAELDGGESWDEGDEGEPQSSGGGGGSNANAQLARQDPTVRRCGASSTPALKRERESTARLSKFDT